MDDRSMRVSRVDDAQERWAGTLGDLAALSIGVPECQRHVDQARVEKIVQWQMGRIARGLPALFLGDVAVLGRCGSELLAVDGQHRLAAVRAMVASGLDVAGHPATVLVLLLSNPRSPLSLREAFVLVNAAVPVPDYIIDGSVSSAQRTTLRATEAELRRRFGPFFSNATRPRQPNVSLSALMSAFAAAAARHRAAWDAWEAGLGSGGVPSALCDFVAWAGARLEAQSPGGPAADLARTKAAKHLGSEPCFLSIDPTFDFVEAWLPEFMTAADSNNAKQPSRVAAPTPQQPPPRRRASLPLAVRAAVWNRSFGERAGTGACASCGVQLTQQTYECGHIVPVARGGTNHVDNLRPLCRTCNRSMGARAMTTFVAAHMRPPVS